jgi:glucose-6-phosphate isomerase
MSVQLPDEAISYEYTGLLAPVHEPWTAAAELRARHLLAPTRLKDLLPRLNLCRGQVAAEREIRQPPPDQQPLEPGFIDLPQQLLDDYRRKGEASQMGQVLTLAARLRDEVDRVVVLGVGGAPLGARALFGALKSAYHNELPPESRLGVPRIYFDGDSADNDTLQELLELLQITCVDPEQREERWAVVAVSKSGATLEPAVALRAFRREATEYYGLRSPWLARIFAAVTGTNGRLRELYRAWGQPDGDVLTIPDNVGSRFAVFTPAGLLPAAIMGLDVRALLLGAKAMTQRFLEEPFERNPVLQFAAVNYLLAEDKPLRVLSIWSRKLEAVGPWYDQLVAQSLGKYGRGPTPLSMVPLRDLHVRGQQHQDGPRDRLINNLVVKAPRTVPVGIGMEDNNQDDLNRFNRRSLIDVMAVAHAGANRAYYDTARPTATLTVPAVSEHTMGQLLQMLMLATVVEARLMGLNPYTEPGTEVYRQHLLDALRPAPPAEKGE